MGIVQSNPMFSATEVSDILNTSEMGGTKRSGVIILNGENEVINIISNPWNGGKEYGIKLWMKSVVRYERQDGMNDLIQYSLMKELYP